jgi:hypothetical protein
VPTGQIELFRQGGNGLDLVPWLALHVSDNLLTADCQITTSWPGCTDRRLTVTTPNQIMNYLNG